MVNIIHELCVKLTGDLLGCAYSEENIKCAKICYGLECLITEIAKIFITFLLFFYMGYGKEFIFCFLVIFFIRRYLGGVHMKTQFGCLLFSLMVYGVAIFWGNHIHITVIGSGVVFIVLIVMMVAFAPIETAESPPYTKREKRNIKIKGLIGIFLIFIMYMIFDSYRGHMMTVFLVQILEVIVVKTNENIMTKKRKRSSKGNKIILLAMTFMMVFTCMAVPNVAQAGNTSDESWSFNLSTDMYYYQFNQGRAKYDSSGIYVYCHNMYGSMKKMAVSPYGWDWEKGYYTPCGNYSGAGVDYLIQVGQYLVTSYVYEINYDKHNGQVAWARLGFRSLEGGGSASGAWSPDSWGSYKRAQVAN